MSGHEIPTFRSGIISNAWFQVQVSGLAVDESTNGEEVMNQALQREKQKLKEILTTNTLILSEQTSGILNSKLETMTKRQMVDIITSWCDSR